MKRVRSPINLTLQPATIERLKEIAESEDLPVSRIADRLLQKGIEVYDAEVGKDRK